MRHLAHVFGIAALVVGCGRTPSSDTTKGVASTTTPSASASADIPGASGDPKAMAADLDAFAGFIDVAVRSCQRSPAHAEAVAKLRQAEAASYADRDELKIRVDRGQLGARDLPAWHREIKKRMFEVNVLARSCAKP